MLFWLVIRGRGTVGELSCRDFGGERPLFGGPCRPKVHLGPGEQRKGRELRNKRFEKNPRADGMLLRRTPAQAESLAAQFLGESGFRHGQTPSRLHLWPMQPLAAL